MSNSEMSAAEFNLRGLKTMLESAQGYVYSDPTMAVGIIYAALGIIDMDLEDLKDDQED